MNAHVPNLDGPNLDGPNPDVPNAHLANGDALSPIGGEARAPDYLALLKARVGTTLGVSGWVVMDQRRIDRFAEATGDHQFVHVDPVRAAAETPFGGTIAHGYLTLAMVGTFAAEILPPHPAVRMVVNMGADKVRLLAPVRVDQRIRGVFVLAGLSNLPDGRAALRARVTIEAVDADAASGTAPVAVLTADLSLMLVLARSAAAPAGETDFGA